MSKGTIYLGNINVSATYDDEYNGPLVVGGDTRAIKCRLHYVAPHVQVGGVRLGGGTLRSKNEPPTYGGRIPGRTAEERRKWLEDNGFIK